MIIPQRIFAHTIVRRIPTCMSNIGKDGTPLPPGTGGREPWVQSVKMKPEEYGVILSDAH